MGWRFGKLGCIMRPSKLNILHNAAFKEVQPMPRQPKTVIEYRNYELPPHFPIQILTGEHWRISDVPAGVLHFHNCLEIGLCESDGGILAFQGEERAFHAGDVTVIAGDVLHTTWSDPGTASKWSYLHLDPMELERPFFPPEAIPNTGQLQQVLQGHYYILSPEEHPHIQELVRAILREMEEKQMNYRVSVRGLILALLIELMRINAREGNTNIAGTIPVAPALEYVNEHYMEDFPIETLAELCGMSQSHFRKIFKELMNVGPLEHLNRTRILKACSLMRMSDASILSISSQVGFLSLSSFNRHFQAEMGTSPSRWRATAGNNPKTSILKYSGWLTPPKV